MRRRGFRDDLCQQLDRFHLKIVLGLTIICRAVDLSLPPDCWSLTNASRRKSAEYILGADALDAFFCRAGLRLSHTPYSIE